MVKTGEMLNVFGPSHQKKGSKPGKKLNMLNMLDVWGKSPPLKGAKINIFNISPVLSVFQKKTFNISPVSWR